MNPETLIVRADASVAQGMGHVMRCLALAQAFQKIGGMVLFAMSEATPRSVRDRVTGEGMKVAAVQSEPGSEEDADEISALARGQSGEWVVVDGYHFGAAYQLQLKQAGLKVLFVDDYGHAAHYSADLVLNPNLNPSHSLYQEREPYTRLLLGPRFALLRSEFLEWRNWQREIAQPARKILITMGGSDPDNVTSSVMEGLRSLRVYGLELTVVLGANNPHHGAVEKGIANYPHKVRLLTAVTKMSEWIAWTDIAITAGGGTCYELALLQTPMVIITVADNQEASSRDFGLQKAAIYAGYFRFLDGDRLSETVAGLMANFDLRRGLAHRARELVDGEGGHRVVERMVRIPRVGSEGGDSLPRSDMNENVPLYVPGPPRLYKSPHVRPTGLNLRPVELKDCRLLWQFANDPEVRAASFSPSPIPWERHEAWLIGKLKNPNSRIFVALDEQGRAVGQLRVELRTDQDGEIDVSVARELRGSGYGTLLIDLGVHRLFTETGAQRLHALIREENEVSRRAFERAGFHYLEETTVNGFATVRYIRGRDERQEPRGRQ